MRTPIDERAGLPSASSAERLYNCSGSLRAEREAPPQEPSDEALQGTEIHAAKESDDFTGLDEEGRIIAENLTKLEQTALDEWLVSIPKQEVVPEREHALGRCWIRDRKTQDKIGSALIDVAWIGKEDALLLNLKTGYLPVTPAFRSIQTRIEVLALWHEYPRLKRIRGGHAQYRFKGRISVVDYDVPLLELCEQEYVFKKWMAEQDYASFNAGPWCRYCKARGNCTAAASYSLLPVVQVGNVAAEITPEQCVAAVRRLTVPQAAFMHNSAAVIRKILDANTDRLKGEAADMLAEVGLMLGKPGSRRELPDAQNTWEHLWLATQTHGKSLVSLQEFQTCVKPQLGRVEGLLTDKIVTRDGCTVKEAKARAAKLLEPIVTYADTEPRLLPLKE